jgi:hypothetical protein
VGPTKPWSQEEEVHERVVAAVNGDAIFRHTKKPAVLFVSLVLSVGLLCSARVLFWHKRTYSPSLCLFFAVLVLFVWI